MDLCERQTKVGNASDASDDTEWLDERIRLQLDAIRQEEVPERLLDLSRELQRLLRAPERG